MGLCWLLVKTRKPARFKVAPGRVRVLNAFPGSGRVPGTRRALPVCVCLQYQAKVSWNKEMPAIPLHLGGNKLECVY